MNLKFIDYDQWRDNMIQYCKENGLVASECDSCNGTLFIKCSECHGYGEIECECCGHSHECSNCEGDGDLPCPDCNENGVDISEYSYELQKKHDLEAYNKMVKG